MTLSDATRCDLHLHSNASTNTEEWYGRLYACPESYAHPVQQYELCKKRGMTLVTLTDHYTIAGGLQLIDRPDFFLSEEVTTRFPETGCVVHVLAWNIDPDQHRAIQECRHDVYRLVEYLQRREIAHALAHPLLSPNWRLDADTFEKLLLLFPTFELVNGMTDARIEADLPALLAGLDETVIAALVRKHGLTARGTTPHRKAATAGSDDHDHRRCGTVFTEVAAPGLSPAAFLRRCMAGEARVVGKQADLNVVHLAVHNTTYHYLRQRSRDEGVGSIDPFTDLSDAIAGRHAAGPSSAGFVEDLLAGLVRLPRAPGGLLDGLRPPDEPSDAADAEVVGAFARVLDVAMGEILQTLVETPFTLNIYRAADGLKRLTCTAAAAAPFLFAADHFAKQHAQVRRVKAQWTATPLPPSARRLALFSDSLEQIDGVSTWCRRFARQAGHCGFEVLVPYCGDGPDGASLHPLPVVTSFPVPLYPGMRLHVPSLLGTIDFLWRQNVSHVELATPGPMGLVGLLTARLLRLPVTASYHTALPSLASSLGGAEWMVGVMRRLVGWFYNQVDKVFVYSEQALREVVELGVSPDRVQVLPLVVDPDDFSPARRAPSVFGDLGIETEGRPVVLSVGRLSAEKNLPVIVDAVRNLQGGSHPPVLVIVGDGPERRCLEARYAGEPFVRFAGALVGEPLQRLYASSRAFVFAIRVDTLGMVNLEAMSSGIPILIPSDASMAALAQHGIAAEHYDFGVDGLSHALGRVLRDGQYAEHLGRNARRAMVERWESSPFHRVWESFSGAN